MVVFVTVRRDASHINFISFTTTKPSYVRIISSDYYNFDVL